MPEHSEGTPGAAREERPKVCLVVPGRNAAATLRVCLEAAERVERTGLLDEILYVDDGSTDESREIAASLGVRCLDGGGRGPGAARNVGWRATSADFVWFVDSDCVVEPDTLDRLLEALDGTRVVGVGGSYSNAVPGSLVARLIHAEIRERHLELREPVDYLGSFNVVYRRSILKACEGFDEGWLNGPGAPGAEDADLSYRIVAAGHRLAFRAGARVAHHHPVSLGRYLRAQFLHGFWGVRLYRRHPGRGWRNSYSEVADHLQPPIAILALAALPLVLISSLRWVPGALLVGLVLTTLPMTARLLRRRRPELILHAPFASLRAFSRGLGMTRGLWDWLVPGDRSPRR